MTAVAEFLRPRMSFEDHYTTTPNAWARDERLSRRARGLLTEMLSHRQDWVITEASLVRSGPEGRDAIRSTVQELESFGYLERDQERGEGGKFGSSFWVLRDPFAADGETVDGLSGDGDSAPIEEQSIQKTISQKDSLSASEARDDVERLLDLLDEEIRKNGVRKLPARNQGNANAMRLLLDRDGFTEDEVAAVIRWAQADQFWHTNILSASKLRAQFAKLDAQMRSGRGRSAAPSAASRALAVDLGGNPIRVEIGSQVGVEQSRAIGPSILNEMNQGRW